MHFEILVEDQSGEKSPSWERLADAVFPGGSAKLSAKGWQAIGTEKSRWAKKISPSMNVHNNASPSFIHFRDKLSDLTG